MARFGRAKLLIFLACSILTTASNGLKQSADIGNANYPPSSDEIHNDPQKMDRLYIPSGTYKVTNKDPHHRTYSEPHPSDSKSDRSRFRRDSNENFTSIVDRMEKISRVVNGISIQQGIINGTIKPDVLIAELLNFGSVSLSDIDGIKLDELSKVVQEIQSLSTTLAKDDGVTKMENRLKKISLFVRESNGVSELKEPSKEYFDALTAWKNLTVNWAAFDDLTSSCLSVLNVIKTFKSQSVSPSDMNSGISTLAYLVRTLATGNLDTYSATLKSDVLRKADSIFAPFISFQKSVASFRENEELLTYSQMKDNLLLKSLQDQLNALNDVVDGSNRNLPNFSMLQQLFIGRHHRNSGNILIHTNGFPNGFKDLEMVSDDLKDPWIEQAVDGQSESLAKALVQLRTLERDIESVDQTMGLKTNAETVSMTDIHKKVTMLSKLVHPFRDVAGKLLDIQNACPSVNVQPLSQDAFVILQNQIVEFTKKLKAIDHVIAVTHTLNTGKKTQLTAVSNTCKSLVVPNYAKTWDELKNSKDLKEVVDLILPLQASLGLIGKSASFEPLSNILQNYTTIATYVNQSKLFTSMLKNLQGIKELSQVDEVIDALGSHRDIKISSFDPVASKLEKVRPMLKDLQSSIGKMKGADSLEKKSLVEIRDVFKDSQNIGGATRVFRSMQVVKKKNQTVMTPAMEKLIQNQLKHVSQPQQDQLNQLLGLDKELTTLIAAIDKIETSVTPSPSTDLVSLWPIFSLANQAKGIPMDFLEISDTIDELSKDPNLKNHQKDLLKIKNDLDSLDSLGLDYSKHQTAIKETEESLKQLDLFFAAYEAKVTPIVPTVPTPKTLPPPTAQSSISGSAGNIDNEKHLENTIPDWVMYVIFVISLISVGVSGGFCWNRFDHYKSNRVFPIMINENLFEVYLADIVSKVVRFAAQYRANEPLSDVSPLWLIKKKSWFGNVQYMHANLIKYKNNFKLGLLQAPQLANAATGAKETVGMFYWAMKEQKATLIVCMVKIGIECCQYFPVKVGDKLTFADGNLVVTCKSLEEEHDGKIRMRTLEVKFKGCRSFTITHSHYDEWTNKLPVDLSPIMSIFEKMDKEKVVFMHCDFGIYRSGIMAQVLMNKTHLEMDRGRLAYGSAVNDVRKIRTGVIKNGVEFLDMVILTFKYFRTFVPDIKHFSKETKEHIFFSESAIAQYVRDLVHVDLDLMALNEMNQEKVEFMEKSKKEKIEKSKKEGKSEKKDGKKSEKKDGKKSEKKDGKKSEKKAKSEKKGEKSKKKVSVKDVKESKPAAKDPKKNQGRRKSKLPSCAPNPMDDLLCELSYYTNNPKISNDFKHDIITTDKFQKELEKKLDKTVDDDEDVPDLLPEEVENTQEITVEAPEEPKEGETKPKEGETKPKEEVKEKKKKKRKNKTITESVEYEPGKEYPVGTRFKRLDEEIYLDDFLTNILK
ncbi:hypothetical protein CRE_20928 [Caenorhabditis remanei]|uniref:Tyrosine-protein phosphatase domain-containing protein n=1 Tax=Caenorhabditis remanei TaxID=31234 RepID=E3N929_CAERE|nr:hypothetical protein CRE_20928 [Caenorhabditis remanei]